MRLVSLSRFAGGAHALRLWYDARRDGTKMSRCGYTIATSFVGQCCREMGHFMHNGASQKISLVRAEEKTTISFDRLENKDNLPVDEHR